jgi:FO synthase
MTQATGNTIIPTEPPAPPSFEATSPAIREILERALDGREISEADGLALFSAQGADLTTLVNTADVVRHRHCGPQVSFVVTRNINFTNVCYMGCRFCGFARHQDDEDAELLPPEEVGKRAAEARARGASEVCIQGGLHPNIPGEYYRDIVKAIRTQSPDTHIHAFSPFEIWYGHKKRRMSVEDYLRDLKEQGLGTIPGTAAEILDTDIRKRLTRNKLSTEAWVSIVKAAHRVGLRSTSTIMYGHIDSPKHWVAHMALLRDIQKETGGFTEFVPLPYVHYDNPLFREEDDARPGPTEDETTHLYAVARLMFAGWIDNIQVSWPKLGPEGAQQMLSSGANDMGGTLMNERITTASGGHFGQEVTPLEMVKIIRAAGRIPVQRNTLYETLETYDDHDPIDYGPLVSRAQTESPITFLETRPANSTELAS